MTTNGDPTGTEPGNNGSDIAVWILPVAGLLTILGFMFFVIFAR